VEGLGLLDVTTSFGPDKVVCRRSGTAMGQPVHGYQIHHGRVTAGSGAAGWLHLTGEPAPPGGEERTGEDEGAVDLGDATVVGTTLHGLFESDPFRAAFLCEVGRRAGKTFVPAGVSFAAARTAQFDRLADALEAHLDLGRLTDLIASASASASATAREMTRP
jgi:adenosylcobyric acid synthase